MTTPSAIQSPFTQFQNLLREMFQFDGNDLDFGLFKVLRLKHTFIERFISGDGKRIDQRHDHRIACVTSFSYIGA